jgi:glycine/D-amino acid oxidase-like deaminating enzyme
MDAPARLDVDVAIFGGGCAGLWLLDDLRRRGLRVLLLEAGDLGSGQTASAQGILHGGLKYSLAGLLSSSARMVREMPAVWEESLCGKAEPDLSTVRSRAAWCYLWRGQSLKSWTSMLAAVTALQVKPTPLDESAIPAPLAACPRPLYRLDERVIDPASFLEVLAHRNRGLIWQIDARDGLAFANEAASATPGIQLRHPRTKAAVQLSPRSIVLAAGEGNAGLREQLGLPSDVMQRRTLRVALVRGELPVLNGHCVDGAKTRVTITSDVDSAGRCVWQLGGQISEVGVGLPREEFLKLAHSELAAVLPGWQMPSLEWAEFSVDRAERSTSDGLMPGDVQILRDGNVLTVWPTKLVMAPLLSRRLLDLLEVPASASASDWLGALAIHDWPAPQVALAPWQRELTWTVA